MAKKGPITEKEMQENPTFIQINEGKVNTAFYTMWKDDGNGMFVGYIPAYDIVFSALTEEEVERRGSIMVRAFYEFWFNQGWKQFILQIHKLGFRARGHDLAMKNLLHKRPQKAKFKSNINKISKADDFDKSSIVSQDVEMAL